MNYSGIFDAEIAAGGSSLHSGAHIDTVSPQPNQAPPGAIIVPDVQLLFNGDFKRAGVDLILSKDGRELVLQDYFRGEKHAALCSPDGARLTGDIVDALTGHTQFAQADGNASAGKVIGHVTKLAGTATAIRNGVSIILHQGDNVEKGDVVQSGSGSTLGITFIDGTVFGLSSNARMVLNEMVYDPNGSNNSSLLSLVQGTITFVAGETAKHGDMKVNTPVATMGIRGTAVLVEIDFTVPGQGGAPPVKFQVLLEPGGRTGDYGIYSLTDPNLLLGEVNTAGQVWMVTPSGDVSRSPAPPLSLAAQEIIGQTFQAYFQAPPPNNANPRSNGPPGSTPANPPPPGKPGDTSPLKFDNGAPTTVIIPINLPAPTPTNPNAINPLPTPIPVTITVLKAIDVTPVVDTPSFNIGNQVTISDSSSSDTLLPYVPGTATILSVVGPAPTGTNLASLVSVDPQTGKVTYNPESFAFLQPGQKVTVTVGFDSQAGTNIFHETLTLTIDNVLPMVTIATSGGITSHSTQTISGAVADGHAAVGATVTLFDTVNGVTTEIGTATVQPDGTWTATVTLSGNGAHSIVAKDTDAAGNTGSSVPLVLTFDTQAPTVTITTAAETSAVATQTISGTVTAAEAAVGATVVLFDTVNGVTTEIGTATVQPDGTWTATVALSGDGAHSIVAEDTDAAGNTGSSAPLVLTLANPTDIFAWASDTSGSWSVPSNWNNDGLVPGTNDHAEIDFSDITVTVASAVAADTLASAATLDITSDGSLTIFGTAGDSSNSGTIEIHGALELDGGAFDNRGSEVHTGSIVVESGGTLTVHGATLSGGEVTIGNGDGFAPPATLLLDNGATVSNSTLTINAYGMIDVEYGTSGPGATLDSVTVINYGDIDVDLEASGGILVLDDGTTITGGALSIGHLGTLDIEYGPDGPGATLDDVSIENCGTMQVDAASASASTLTLDDGTTISGGLLTIGSGSTLEIVYGSNDLGATLDGVIVTADDDSSTIAVGTSGAVTLALIDGAAVTGGTLLISIGSVLDLNEAILTGVAVADSGVIEVNGDSTISGGTIESDAITATFAPISAYTWVDGTSGDWGTGSDWYGGVVPDGKSNATIGGTGAETVTVSSNQLVNLLTLSDANATLEVTDFATLSVYGGFAVSAAQAINVSWGTLVIGGGAVTLDGTTLELGAAGSAPEGFFLPSTLGTLSIEYGTTLTLGPNLTLDVVDGQISALGSLDNEGTITTVGSGGELDIQTFGDFTNSGTITFSAPGGSGGISALSSFDNEGSIVVTDSDAVSLNVFGINNGTISVGSGGHLTIGGLTGTGSVTINDGGTLEVIGALANAVNFVGGVGTLQLDIGASLTGTLSGLALGDAIDFADATITSFTVSGDILSVLLAGGQTDTITLGGLLPDGDTLQLQLDGTGGDELVVANAPLAPTPTYTWLDGTSGDFGTGSNWSGDGIVPDAKSNATISGTGSETVTVSSNESVNVLTLNDANATLSVTDGATLSVYNGVAVTAAKAIDVASGTLLVGGGGATTLNNTTLDLGTCGLAPIYGYLSAEQNTTLTLGPNLIVDVADGQINAYGAIVNEGTIATVGSGGQFYIQVLGGGFTNYGTITFSAQGGFAQFDGLGQQNFDNEGSIVVTNGELVSLPVLGAIDVNNGTISVGSGGVLSIYGDLSGTGSITINDGGTLEVQGNLANAVSFAAGGVGTLILDTVPFGDGQTGTLSGLALGDAIVFAESTISSFADSGDTLTVAFVGGQTETIKLGGALPTGDTLQLQLDGDGGDELVVANAPLPSTPTYTWVEGTSGDFGTGSDWSGGVVPNVLSNAAIIGTGTETVTVSTDESVNVLTLNDANATLAVTNGAWLSAYGGFAVSAAQAIDVVSGALLVGGNAATLDNTTLELGAAGSDPDGFQLPPTLGTLSIQYGTALTLGPNLTLDVVDGQILDAGSLDNKGTVITVGNGGELDIDLYNGTFTNEGTITFAAHGGTGFIETQGFDNKGSIVVENGDAVSLNAYGPFTNEGTITFAAQGGTGFIETQGFDNEGSIVIENGYAVSLNANGSFTNGSFLPATNNGTISVGLGGLLTVYGNLAGSGSIEIEDGGTLEVSGILSDAVNFAASGIGTLQLDDGSSFTGTLTGLALGDAIDFANATISNAIVNGDVLTVTLTNGQNETITLAGALPEGDALQVQLDGHGGDELVVVEGLFGDVTIEAGQALTLDDGTTIMGGALSIGAGSTLKIASGSNDIGATLDAVHVRNSGAIQIGAVDGDLTLTLDDGTTITGGTLSIGSGDTLDIELGIINGPGAALHGATLDNEQVLMSDCSSTITVGGGSTLALDNATISGGTIDDYSIASAVDIPGLIDITGSSTIDGASLNGGILKIEAGQTLTLDDVTMDGTTFVGTGSGDDTTLSVDTGATLTLNGIALSAGLVSIGGQLDSSGDSTIDALTVANDGTIEATAGRLNIYSLSASNAGLLEANGGTLRIGGGSTSVPVFDQFSTDSVLNSGWTVVTPNPASSVQLVPGIGLQLTASPLNGGSDLYAGSNYNAPVVLHAIDPSLNWTIETELTFSPTDNYQGAGILLATTSGPFTSDSQFNRIAERAFYPDGGGEVVEGAGGSASYSGSSIYLEVTKVGDVYTTSYSSDGIHWTVLGSETNTTVYDEIGFFAIEQPWDNVDVSSQADFSFVAGNLTPPSTGLTNTGTIKATADGTLVLSDEIVNNADGIVQVDGGSTLDLRSSSIVGGTVTDSGTIDVTALSAFDDLNLNGGDIAVESGGTLALDGVTVTGTVFTDAGIGSLLQVGGGTTLTLDGATVTGGTIDDGSVISGEFIAGDIDIASSSTIDGGAVLNGGNVTIGAGQTLKLDDITVNGTTFDNTATGSIIQVDSGDTLTLNGVTISGGTFSIAGTVDIAGATTTLDTTAPIMNSGLLAVMAGSTLDVQASEIDNSSTGPGTGILIGASSELLVDNAPGLQLTGGEVVLQADSRITENTSNQYAASGNVLALDIDDLIMGSGEIGSGTVSHNESTIGSLDLTIEVGGIIDASGGTLTIDTGNSINNGGITNDGTLEASFGSKLVIDDAVTGSGSESIADGAVMEFNSSVAVGQTITFNGAGKLYLGDPSDFKGVIAKLSGNDLLDLSGFVAVAASVTAVYTINDVVFSTLTVTDANNNSETLTLAGNYDQPGYNFVVASDGNVGSLVILNQETPTTVTATSNRDDTASASQIYHVKGQTISPANGSGLFISNDDSNAADLIVAELDNTSSINVSAAGFSGIALDIAAPTLTFTSAASIAVFNAATITALESEDIGIFAGANNNVTVYDSGNVSGARYGIEAIEESATVVADVDVSIGPGATISSTDPLDTGHGGYGILAINKGAGNISVRTSATDQISSEGSGIDAVNEASAAPALDQSTIVVNASGTIHSGSIDTGADHPPAGIVAGYFGSDGDSNPTSYIPGLYGDVTVNNSASITADAGDGIRAYNYGIGDVTVSDLAGSIMALGEANVAGYGNGIAAYNYGPGNIDVFTAADASITSGSSGIHANNADDPDSPATAIPSSSEILIVAYGTIASGAILNSDGNPPAGILAGYDSNQSAEDNVHGNVTIDDYATITAAAGTDGIRGYNYGTGTVTVIAEAGADITAGRYGLAARGHDGGDVSVVNYGTVTATTAINANTTGNGHVDIDNHGTITGDIVVGDPSTGDAPFTGNATIHNEGGALWNLLGDSTFTGTSELVNDGTIDSTCQSSITTTGVLNISNDGTVNVQSGALDIGAAVTGAGSFAIADGAHLEFACSVSATEAVTFQGSTGDLTLDNPSSFAALISGFTGDGTLSGSDQIDLKGINYSALSDSFNATTDTLSVSDGTDSATLQFSGSYVAANFSFQSDGEGGTIVYDPPVSSTASSASGSAQAPGAAAGETIVASAANATLTGHSASDNFVFNFAAVGNTTVTDFHADTDFLQFKAALFANTQAILNATQDDGHGNAVIALDAHDTITLAGVTKAQLHQSDLHLV